MTLSTDLDDRHSVAECDRLLRAHPSYDQFRCRPDVWACDCGRVWEHVCDEAEGCFYAEADRTHDHACCPPDDCCGGPCAAHPCWELTT